MASSSPSNSSPAGIKPSPTANTRPNRLPAPTLFVGPPSRNASQLSISRPGPEPGSKATRDPLTRHKSALSRPFGDGAAGDASRQPRDAAAATQLRKPSDKSVDAKWREMQSSLGEVELTAQAATHVFGEKHAAALDELRRAQVELARAWGRGTDVKPAGAADGPELNLNRFRGAAEIAADRVRAGAGGGSVGRKRGDTDASTTSTQLSDESSRSGGTAKTGRSQAEEETAEDIRLASERRAANEAYFRKIDESVKDVTKKLEAVAEAMRGVEGESRSLWSGTSSVSEGENKQHGSPAAGKAAAG